MKKNTVESMYKNPDKMIQRLKDELERELEWQKQEGDRTLRMGVGDGVHDRRGEVWDVISRFERQDRNGHSIITITLREWSAIKKERSQ